MGGVYAEDAVAGGLIDVLQATYNIYEQESRDNLFPLVEAHNVGLIARSPLDEGALTGKITPQSEFAEGDFLDHYNNITTIQ